MPARVKARVAKKSSKRTACEAYPCALAVGGLDPGGGAGIAADLRAFGVADVFGAAAVALLTVQSTGGLRAATSVPTRFLRAQIDEVLRHQKVGAVKTGALGDAANVRLLARLAAKHPTLPFVVDPVMLPTRGSSRLLATSALRALIEELVPVASLVTANAIEAAVLVGAKVETVEECAFAAERICGLGPRAALVKGGHVPRGPAREVVDVLCVGGRTLLLRAPRLALPPLHGGGCTLASLIAGRLARTTLQGEKELDDAIVHAVAWARRAHHRLLEHPRDVGGVLAVLAR